MARRKISGVDKVKTRYRRNREYGPSEGFTRMAGLTQAIKQVQREEKIAKLVKEPQAFKDASTGQLRLLFPTASDEVQ
jgi:hypothetical protein